MLVQSFAREGRTSMQVYVLYVHYNKMFFNYHVHLIRFLVVVRALIGIMFRKRAMCETNLFM